MLESDQNMTCQSLFHERICWQSVAYTSYSSRALISGLSNEKSGIAVLNEFLEADTPADARRWHLRRNVSLSGILLH